MRWDRVTFAAIGVLCIVACASAPAPRAAASCETTAPTAPTAAASAPAPSESKASGAKSDEYPPDPGPDENTRSEAQLSSRLHAQTRDAAWADAMEKELRERAAPLVERGVRIVKIDCGADLCRAEIDTSTVSGRYKGRVSRTLAPPNGSSTYFNREGLPASQYDVMFLERGNGTASTSTDAEL